MTLIERARDILVKPKETWPVIAEESTDAQSIYTRYLVFLAAIPAVCGFIGLALFGLGGAGINLRLPMTFLFVQMVVSYLMTLAMIYIVALIVDALAPTFDATRSRVQALKLVAYSSTAALVGGVFSLVPALSILGIVAALYSIYLLYAGIGALMRCPPGKAGAYTAVVVVCAIVAGIVVAGVSSLLVAPGPVGITPR